MQRQLVIAVSGIITACVLLVAHAAGEPDSLAAARAKWRKMEPQSYSYVVEEHAARVFGICAGPGSKKFSSKEAKITVREGRVIGIASVRGDEFPASCLKGLHLYAQNLHTVEGLFDFIEREQAAHAGSPNMETRYDATFGFPRYVSERDVLDGSTYTVADFQVLKSLP